MAKKLFELLVVEGQFKSQANTTRTELKSSFEKKRHLFEEKRKTFTSNEAGVEPTVEEQSDIQTSIKSELKWISEILSKAYDTSYQVAEGNTKARADVVLDDGTILLENVPATALLELEKRAGEIKDLVKSIPTLDPAKGFSIDPSKPEGTYRARDVVKARTKKSIEVITKAQATKEHPAQTEMINVDKVIGTILEQEWSSLITPAQKGLIIERAEELQRSCKSALHRANALELTLPLPTCGKKIFDYVFKLSD